MLMFVTTAAVRVVVLVVLATGPATVKVGRRVVLLLLAPRNPRVRMWNRRQLTDEETRDRE
jgi:hypothetical protein